MDRRSALRNFVILSAGIAFMPSCRDGKVKGVVAGRNIQLSGDQEYLLTSLSETILPVKGEAPSDAAHLFVLTMVDDCYSKEEQQQFLKGLQQFDELAQKKFDKTFVECSTAQKHALLTEMESRKEESEPVNYFYNTTRSLTLQHYTSSKYYLVTVRKFEMAPGRYHGCFPLEKKSA
jgi:hypothetical protein